jgi:putative ABC transport system permease protein
MVSERGGESMDFTEWLDMLRQDIRYGIRQLRLNPGFTAVGVLSLALGIGANTAIFQLVDAVRLRSLPVQNPQELVNLDFAPKSQRSGWFSNRNSRFTFAQWDEIRTQQKAFSEIFAWAPTRFNLAQGGQARYAEGLLVSGDFFHVLGVPAQLGRTFTQADDRPGCGSPGAVVSYPFWQRELGGDPPPSAATSTLTATCSPSSE